MKKTIVLSLLLIAIFPIFICSSSFAAEEVLPPLPTPLFDDRIEILNRKIDSLTVQENQNIKDSAQNAVNTANLVIQVVTVIFGVAAALGAGGGIIFRSNIKMIEESARISAENMKISVSKARLMEEAINRRKTQIDRFYKETDKLMKEIETKLSAVKSSKIEPKEKESRLSDLEGEIAKLKRKITQVEPYTWSISPSSSTTTYTTTSSSMSPSISDYTSGAASSTTTIPFYAGDTGTTGYIGHNANETVGPNTYSIDFEDEKKNK